MQGCPKELAAGQKTRPTLSYQPAALFASYIEETMAYFKKHLSGYYPKLDIYFIFAVCWIKIEDRTPVHFQF